MAMTLAEITTWLNDRGSRPAPPRKVAVELDDCATTDASLSDMRALVKALETRFMTTQRKQLTDLQLTAIYEVLTLAIHRDNTRNFPKLSCISASLQLIARILNPGLVNQRSTYLCCPAAAIMCVAALQPLKYVRFCISGAGFAPLGEDTFPVVSVRPDIRDYEGPSAKEGMKAADWIACAPIINASRADIASKGANGAAVFKWLSGFGFGRIVYMSNFPSSEIMVAPDGVIPGDSSTTGTDMLAQMIALSDGGFHIAMLGRGELADALQRLDAADKQRIELGSVGIDPTQFYTTARQRELDSLNSTNEGVIKTVLKALIGQSPAHSFHATYLSRIREDGGNVICNCSNWGGDQRWVQVPKSAFANKLTGFVAVAT